MNIGLCVMKLFLCVKTVIPFFSIKSIENFNFYKYALTNDFKDSEKALLSRKKLYSIKYFYIFYKEEFDEKYSHIIEIYDFPTSFKNENIISSFKEIL
jgi:hypothetical protein